MTTYPFHNDHQVEVTKGIALFYCGRCEKEFLVKLKEGQNDPTYQCPKCKTPNQFSIKWRELT